MKRKTKYNLCALLIVVHLASCVKDRNFDPPKTACDSGLIANASYMQVKNLYQGQTIQIQEDLIIEGYVNSSDQAGNFFSVLHFQNSAINPTEGFQIEIDVRDSHLFYSVGSKILIRLKGLYLGQTKGLFKIGGVFASFGNESVGRLPAAILDQHLVLSCETPSEIRPTELAIDDIRESMVNTLVQFNGLEMVEEELGEPFALEQEETERTLKDCNNNELTLLNSGYSDFTAQLLPEGHGAIMGVLLRENNNFQLVIRTLEDVDFKQERCSVKLDEYASTNILISELADPDNNVGARFVELYNSGTETLSLIGWSLYRYTNGNTEISSSIDLSEVVIESEGTIVISPNPIEFEVVYGFAPDLAAGTNSPADSNGDDNLVLVDSFGNVIDVFGVVGEDGSGTNHEFEDGRAVRHVSVEVGNPSYNFEEWTIFNDTGDSGTTNLPQIAPNDFTPGTRN
ncbi:MAG: DUF5689 domain-containing protein [Maribacter sp.]|nr:DUF5689 domain-containing protein [Maribacter sp.]